MLAIFIRPLIYELYKTDWLRRISPERKMNAIKDYYEYLDSEHDNPSFEDYINEFGYDGEIYACFEEFLDSEYKDENYIKSLLSDSHHLYELYMKDMTAMSDSD